MKQIKDGVQFTNIRNTNIRTGQKISVGKYEIDEQGNIIFNKPIINAIDIDWNAAKINGINDSIETSADLLNQIGKIKNLVDNIKVPKSVWELSGSSELFTIDEFNSIKDTLKGKSAFEIARDIATENGQYFPYESEVEWIASLKGERGTDGKSAYELARDAYLSLGLEFPYRNEAEWIISLKGEKGDKGDTGKSAFEIARETYTEMGLPFDFENEIEWMENMVHMTDETKLNELIDEKIQYKQNILTSGIGIEIDENDVISATANTWIKIVQ